MESEYYPIVKMENAVVMFGGMGDPMYLTLDGRVIIEDRMDDGPPREAATLREATMAVVIGAKLREFPELLSILPERPLNSVDCQNSDQAGWYKVAESLPPIVCHECGGLGWKENEESK
jgi:hypothetical protein